MPDAGLQIVGGGGAPSFGPPMASGRWYLPWGTSGLTTFAVAANNRLYATPVLLPAFTLSGIAVEVTAAGDAAGVLRLGIYDDVHGMPTNLVSEFGTVAADAIAVPTLAPTLALAAGWYWLAACFQGQTTTRATVRCFNAPYNGRCADTFPGTASAKQGYNRDNVSGALPTPFGVPNGVLQAVQSPAIWIQGA